MNFFVPQLAYASRVVFNVVGDDLARAQGQLDMLFSL
jgi:hypothetical protein